jgi:hypothetical protein
VEDGRGIFDQGTQPGRLRVRQSRDQGGQRLGRVVVRPGAGGVEQVEAGIAERGRRIDDDVEPAGLQDG